MEYGIIDFLQLLGSLGLFIYGMKMMSEGLQKVAEGLVKVTECLKGRKLAEKEEKRFNHLIKMITA